MSGVSLHTAASAGGPPAAPVEVLTRRQKAAVIVRLLLSQGEQIPLSALSEAHQAELTEAMARMRAVSRATLRAVVEEFLAELESVGLSFPGGIDAALEALDGHLSATTVSRLRRKAMSAGAGDPWAQIAGLPPDVLLGALERESIEVGAVMLSKLSVARAAELLGRLPGERARRLAHAIAETGRIGPENVRRIGLALLDSLDAMPERAFDTTPVERVGAILNHSPAATRDEVLEGLEQEDAAFAAEVRKAIFTFADIPARVAPADVPRIAKECDASVFVTALAAALAGEEGPRAAAEFLLGGLSQRMAGQLRDEIADRGAVKAKDGEAAMGQVVAAIRALEGRGELILAAREG
ncbi:MAG: flagellar motor switch protein FliG [Rhodobacteraceae bacterium]|nr:flagellar motor switch protein FliG [Paracoccaceae bacterium]